MKKLVEKQIAAFGYGSRYIRTHTFCITNLRDTLNCSQMYNGYSMELLSMCYVVNISAMGYRQNHCLCGLYII